MVPPEKGIQASERLGRTWRVEATTGRCGCVGHVQTLIFSLLDFQDPHIYNSGLLDFFFFCRWALPPKMLVFWLYIFVFLNSPYPINNQKNYCSSSLPPSNRPPSRTTDTAPPSQ